MSFVEACEVLDVFFPWELTEAANSSSGSTNGPEEECGAEIVDSRTSKGSAAAKFVAVVLLKNQPNTKNLNHKFNHCPVQSLSHISKYHSRDSNTFLIN